MKFPLILFIVVPMTELLILFEVAAIIGGVYTLLLVITTAFIGVTVLKRQGFHTLRRANLRMEQGQLPALEIVEGMLLAFAGALLLTPGLITDVVGFCCLTPPIRRLIAKRILRSGSTFFVGGMRGGRGPGAGFGAGGFRGPGFGRESDQDSHTVEGDYVNEDERNARPGLDEGPEDDDRGPRH